MEAALKNNVLNLNKIRGKMKDPPTKYKLYNFFCGMTDMLTEEQLTELREIVQKEHDKFTKALDKQISKIKKNAA